MLDPKIIKENPEKIQDMLKARAVDFDFDGIIQSDQKRREFIIKTDELRKKKNQVALEISQKKKQVKMHQHFKSEMKNVSSELDQIRIRTRKN